MDATAKGAARRRKKKKAPPADAAKKWPGGGDPAARGIDPGASPMAPPADAGGRGPAMADCAASCCLIFACIPVAALCCVARTPLRAARRCWRCCRWRRRPPRPLAPGDSSSFSDDEIGEFLKDSRAMPAEKGRPPSR